MGFTVELVPREGVVAILQSCCSTVIPCPVGLSSLRTWSGPGGSSHNQWGRCLQGSGVEETAGSLLYSSSLNPWTPATTLLKV